MKTVICSLGFRSLSASAELTDEPELDVLDSGFFSVSLLLVVVFPSE